MNDTTIPEEDTLTTWLLRQPDLSNPDDTNIILSYLNAAITPSSTMA